MKLEVLDGFLVFLMIFIFYMLGKYENWYYYKNRKFVRYIGLFKMKYK